jgi:hypothetical protein
MGPRSIAKGLGIGVIGAAGVYGFLVAWGWYRYGYPSAAPPAERDVLLDTFMPAYDIGERHHIAVNAPAALTLQSAASMDVEASPVVRAIFRTREFVMGATAARRRAPQGFIDEMRSIGWGTLAEVPGRQIVMGAVTQPWTADVVFRALPPAEFRAFSEPGFVKIVWTVRADAVGEYASVFRTETRAVPTDALARAKFRRYWSLVSPGIVAIRWLLLRPVKLEAERRTRVPAAPVRNTAG